MPALAAGSSSLGCAAFERSVKTLTPTGRSEDLTLIPRISQKRSAGMLVLRQRAGRRMGQPPFTLLLALTGRPIKGFCEIREICVNLRQVFPGRASRGPTPRPEDGDSSSLRSE